jgi:hypothetical protein
MVARSFILVIVSFFATTILSKSNKIYFTGKEQTELISTRETKNCFVSLVKIGETVYLVKQKKDPRKQLAVVRDALASYIARDLEIAQLIAIVPFHKTILGKMKPDWPATIHSLAPGKTVREQRDNKYNELRLRQFWAGASQFSEKGLTRAIIAYMTWHKQLPIIVALDLMIANSDRHCGNLCYDPVTDTFFAIDMDDTFNKDLCLFACEKIMFMLENDGVIFTKEEIEALVSMKNTLRFLVKRHNPENLIKKLHEFATQAGFYKGSKLYTQRIENKLKYYEQMIKQSYASAQKLISLLEKTITHKSRRLAISMEAIDDACV